MQSTQPTMEVDAYIERDEGSPYEWIIINPVEKGIY